MISTKQRSYLKGLANDQPAILHIGKGGLNENAIKQADDALLARELIKVRVLRNALEDTGQIAQKLAERLDAELVAQVGKVFILFRRNPKNPKISI